jgi:hypothetical protein
MLRPEQLNVRPAENGPAIVDRVHYFGHDRLLDLVWPGSGLRVHARVPGQVDWDIGERVEIVVDGAALAFPRAAAGDEILRGSGEEADPQQHSTGGTAEQQVARRKRDGTALVGLDSGS